MANLILQDKKFITPENLKLIVNYGLGFASRVKNLEDKEIAPFEADKMYVKDSLTIYDGYIYKAKVTNQSSTFNEIYWNKIGDDITELTLDEIKAMVGLTTEQLTTLSSIILDSEVRLDKTYSSSKIYSSIKDAIDTSKAYTLSELGKMSGASYKVVTATSDMTDERIIYLLDNGTTFDMYIVESGTPTKIGDTNIDLSDYYKKTEIDNDFLKKTDANLTYATKNELVDKVDKTDITTTIDSTSTNDTVPSTKAVFTSIDKIQTDLSTLDSITDLNEFKGKTFMIGRGTGNNNETANIPNGVTGAFVVEFIPYNSEENYGVQKLTLVQASNDKYSTFERSLVDGNWNDWKELVTMDRINNLMIEQIPDNTSFKSLIPTNPIAYKGYVGCFAEFRYAYVVYIRFFDGVRIEKHAMGDIKSAYCIYIPSEDRFTEWVES